MTTLQEVKKYLEENTTLKKIIIKRNHRHGRTLWGYKYEPEFKYRYYSLNRKTGVIKLKNRYENIACIIVNEKEINIDSILEDIKMNNLTK